MKRPSRVLLGATARTPEDVVAVHDQGLDFAEVPIVDPDAFGQVLPRFLEIQKTLDLFYLCHGPREGNPSDEASLEKGYLVRLLQILPLMKVLGMGVITIHLWMDPRFLGAKILRYKIGFLQTLVGRAEQEGIRVCLENLSEQAHHLAPVLEAVPGLSITLDLGHGQLLTGRNTSFEILEQYGPRIRHIHLHDNRGGQSSKDDLHLPPGQGAVPFEEILTRLHGSGYAGTMTLELKPHELPQNLPYVKALLQKAGWTL